MARIKTSNLLPLLSFVLLALFLMLTNPHDLPIILILAPLGLLGFGVFGLTNLGLRTLNTSPGKSRAIAGMSTALILLIVLLQSIGQLHIRDFLILVALLAALTFYFKRLKK